MADLEKRFFITDSHSDYENFIHNNLIEKEILIYDQEHLHYNKSTKIPYLESIFYNGYDGELGAKDIFETLESFYNDYNKSYNNTFYVNNSAYYYFDIIDKINPDTHLNYTDDEIYDEIYTRLSNYIKQHNSNASSDFNLQDYEYMYCESYYYLYLKKDFIGLGYDNVDQGDGNLYSYYLIAKDILTDETLQEVFLGYVVQGYYY